MSLDIMTGNDSDLKDVPPTDDIPPTDDTGQTGWFNAEYPHSTEEHPYGYFPVSTTDASPDYNRPRKRRPHGRGKSGGVATSDRADGSAKTAAAMLARLNSLFSLTLLTVGMPLTREELLKGNEQFEVMAYEALLSDPALARKILSAGATSGKAQLALAYVMLGGTIAPTVIVEMREKREANE